jgi:hypothetical protein
VKPKVAFKADRTTIEAAVGGYTVKAWKDGDGTAKNPWREETAIASTWDQAMGIVDAFLNGPE